MRVLLLMMILSVPCFSATQPSCDKLIFDLYEKNNKVDYAGKLPENVKRVSTVRQTIGKGLAFDEADDEDLNLILSHIEYVNTLLLPQDSKLIIPPNIGVTAHHFVTRPYYDPTKNSLNVGYAYWNITNGQPYKASKQNWYNSWYEGDYVMLPQYSRVITYHEYGHAILQNNLYARFFPIQKHGALFYEYNETYNQIMEIRNLRLRANTLLKNFFPFVPMFDKSLTKLNPKFPWDLFKLKMENIKQDNYVERQIKQIFEQVQQTTPLFFQLLFKKSALEKKAPSLGMDNFSNLFKLMTGLHEVFADLTAVLAEKNNPKAIFESITPRDDYESSKLIEMISRDFSHPANELSQWNEFDQVHAMFSPTRYFLWETYLQKQDYLEPQAQRRLYGNVFDAIVAVLNFRYFVPDKKLSLKEWNLMLMNEIEKRMNIDQ